MPLTRAQLISGDANKGVVLSGQVQGVKQGSGVQIESDGTINFNSQSAEGVVKTNNVDAFNSYVWPGPGAPTANRQLVVGTANQLSWQPIPVFGLGLNSANSLIKTQVPVQTTAPNFGTEPEEAIEGSLYWNSNSEQLFIGIDGSWTPAISLANELAVGLLSGTRTLYVNPEIGKDIYVTGDYSEGVTNQMVSAGYSPQKPFKTIARAALEVARLQVIEGASVNNSKAYDRFIIKCSTGTHYVDNHLGTETAPAWVSSPTAEVTSNELRKLNSNTYAGVILPRGVSIIGEDLRKTVIRPLYVPSKTGNIEADRGSIFRVTGGAFFFNFTFKDSEEEAYAEDSHHLLDCFSFVTQSHLQGYYVKVGTTFAQDPANQIVNPGETEIVAPQPPSNPGSDTDGVLGSSPYIFNCSVRSRKGLCGINADGAGVTGFKSMVVAQFTGTSLQTDMFCWQIYNEGVWKNITDYDSGNPDYQEYITGNPNNIRMNPDRVSFHIRAINDAFIQEVSVFAIGQGIHHWVKSGGEISITNSNSSFGGCAAIAEGYKTYAFDQDTNWDVTLIKVPYNLNNQNRVVSKIALGVVKAGVDDETLTIQLENDLLESIVYPGQPEILASKGYSFVEDSLLWVENPSGEDWSSPLGESAWDPNSANEIKIKDPMNSQSNKPPGEDNMPNLVGKTVYIRRLVDTRTEEQRRYTLILGNSSPTVRTPPKNFVIQTVTGGENIEGLIANSRATSVIKSGSIPVGDTGFEKRAEIIIGRANAPSGASDWDSGSYYRPGDTVRRNNKHFTCLVRNSDTAFNPEYWEESYVHMPESYVAYDYVNNSYPLVIFDNDTDEDENSDTCGYEFNPSDPQYCWENDINIKKQYRSATDFKGVESFLRGLGFIANEVLEFLLPANQGNREKNPKTSTVLGTPTSPPGAANAKGNWPIEFRRPSIVRLFSHAWEWAGFLNYTKALPSYQGDLSPQNQFTYYFTNNAGGRVFASGYNQEGLLVTAAGLTDLASGQTIDVANIGNQVSGVDVPSPTNNLDELTVGTLTVSTVLNFPAGAIATDTKPGISQLAKYSDLINTVNPYIATGPDDINNKPEVVTIGGLNAWKTAQKLVSLGGGDVTIYVSAEDPKVPGSPNPDDRTTVAELLENPPITPGKAVCSLKRAAQYANQVVSGIGGQTAIVKVAAGLYDPTSTWECNVTFVSYKSVVVTSPQDPAATFSETNRAFPSVASNFSDYYGYDKEIHYGDVEKIPNFWSFYLSYDDSASSYRVFSFANTLTLKRSATFEGGFAFLGMPKLINLLSAASTATSAPGPMYDQNFTRVNFVRNFTNGDPTSLSGYTFAANEGTNIDSLLASLKADKASSKDSFVASTQRAAISCQGLTNDTVTLKDCSFGSIIPCHKEGGGPDEAAPYIEVKGSVGFSIYNIYIVGVSTITRAGISIGSTTPLANALPLSGDPPYGTSDVTSAWTWTQTHHTFISTPVGSNDTLNIKQIGGKNFVLTGSGINTRSYYQNSSSKLLPNHINLYDISGNNLGTALNGPFFDQFIHAKLGLSVSEAWSVNRVAEASGGVFPGFVGKFGKNSYNTTLTRGVRLGDQGYLEPESNYSLTLGRDVITTSDGEGRTIFQRAGELFSGRTNGVPPLFFGSGGGALPSDSYGQGYPIGNSTDPTDQSFPVITTADAGSSTLDLNLGIRCIRKGISPEYGNIVRYNSAI